MERKYLIISIFSLFVSCKPMGSCFLNLVGNYEHDSGDYQGANISYQKSLDFNYYNDWISYNLGNVFHALGEINSAEAEWDKALKSESPYLLSRLFLNKGILSFEQGEYKKAYEYFKKSLILDPSNMNAKINLELSLKKLGPDNSLTPESSGGTSTKGGKDNELKEADRILDYIKNKESGKWKSNKQKSKEDGKNDW